MTGAIGPLLDRVQITDALRRVGNHLHQAGVTADVYVVGGAAMVLAYDAERATRDVDAVFNPHSAVLDAAWLVADELGLPRSWLNDQAAVYVSRVPDQNAPTVFDHPGLRVSAASPEHMLAMKTLAGRRYADRADLRHLIETLRITTVEQVVSVCARVFPDEPVTDRARLLIEDVIEELSTGD